MRQSFVYRLYPSKPQSRRLDATLETCRHFYNDLAECHNRFNRRHNTAS